MDRGAQEFDVEAPVPKDPPRRSEHPARSATGFIVLALALIAAGIAIVPDQTPTERGIVANLESPPALVWETPLNSSHASSGQVWIGAEVIVAAGTNSVHGLDLATGEPVWEVRAPQMRCARQGEDITCASRQGTRAELIEMTMNEGEIARTAQTGLVAAHPHDGGVITVFEESGTLTVMRWGGSEEHLWSYDVAGAQVDLEAFTLTVVDDLVLAQAPPVEPGPMFFRALSLRDGTHQEQVRAMMTYAGEWLVDRDGDMSWWDQAGRATPVEGMVLPVDDALGSGHVLSAEPGELRARDDADGGDAWTFTTGDLSAPSPIARLAQVLLLWSDQTLYALDGADGSLLWSRPGEFPWCPCYGSGRVAAWITGEDEPALSGIDVTTGEELWDVQIADFRRFSYGTDGTLLGVFTVSGLSLWSLG